MLAVLQNSAGGSNRSTSSRVSSCCSSDSCCPVAIHVLLPRNPLLESYRVSGLTGITVRPNVELVTAANEAYHAASAVARPTQPPNFTMPSVVVHSPMPRMKNVAASRTNTSATAAVVRSDAMNMYAVKIPQATRYTPTALPTCAGGTDLAKNCSNAQNDSQKEPYDVKATAPNVLPVRNSHMPASS